MAISAVDFTTLPAAAGDRRQRTRFQLSCPLRLLRGGAWAGESRTKEINCEGFSCFLPGRFTPGDTFECEIELSVNPWNSAKPVSGPALRLHCRAMVIRITKQQPDGVEVACRLLSYVVSPAPLVPSPALAFAAY